MRLGMVVRFPGEAGLDMEPVLEAERLAAVVRRGTAQQIAARAAGDARHRAAPTTRSSRPAQK